MKYLEYNVSSRHSGSTLVEFLVVLLITGILAAWCGPAYLRTSRLERNLRNEAFVRSKLAMHLATVEQYLSLGTNVVYSEGACTIGFPIEVGGVSLESNRLARVSKIDLKLRSDKVKTEVIKKNEALDVVMVTRSEMDAFPLFMDVTLGSKVCEMTVEGEGEIRDVHISAEVPWITPDGTESNRTVTVSRLVRLWNYPQ